MADSAVKDEWGREVYPYIIMAMDGRSTTVHGLDAEHAVRIYAKGHPHDRETFDVKPEWCDAWYIAEIGGGQVHCVEENNGRPLRVRLEERRKR